MDSSSETKSETKKVSNAFSARAWLIIAITVFFISTIIAFSQGPRPDPYDSKSFHGWQWFKNSIEHNAFKRLPIIRSDINDVFIIPGSRKVWIAGSGGLIAHSDNGGTTWEQHTIKLDSKEKEVKAEKATRRFFPSFMQEAFANGGTVTAKKTPDKKIQSKQFLAPDLKQKQLTGKNSSVSKEEINNQSDIKQTEEKEAGIKPVQEELSLIIKYQAIFFVNSNLGWAVGTGGTIIHTTDGGNKWVPQSSQTKDWLDAIHFMADGKTGWAVGTGGTIIHTTDGGNKWIPQSSKTIDWLDAIHFMADGKTGWAVGTGGTIIHTTDGGNKWIPQSSQTKDWLRAIHFMADGKTGWVVGTGGTIIHTTDGGNKWIPQSSQTKDWLRAIHFMADGKTGWVVGTGGTIIHTTDGGNKWDPQSSQTIDWLGAIHFMADGKTGWVVGTGGTIIHTTDGGNKWDPQSSQTIDWLGAIHFMADGKTGWVVGTGGTIIHTTDGGNKWNPQSSQTKDSLRAIHFMADGKTGWVVGTGGTIIHTTDGGNKWDSQSSQTKDSLRAIHFMADGKTGWVVDTGGSIIHTTDGGNKWDPQSSQTKDSLGAIHFMADGKTGWAVDGGGTIIHTTDGGNKWIPQSSQTKDSLRAIHFMADGKTGWAVGNGGSIIHTTDGGNNWNPQSSQTKEWLGAIHFMADGKTGWVVGNGGSIIHTTDGGNKWILLRSAYKKYPAPWYYVSLIIVVALLIPAVKKPKPVEEEIPSIADMLITDRPLEEGDPDPIDFKSVAFGLSRFLRNNNTKPPLTVAITGEWGTGKSSLMNLLKSNITKYGFRPIWFNAWHHQKEEHLLASLLENIHRQAIPALWRWSGLIFRVKLLLRRGWRKWFPILAMLFLFIYSMGYFVADPTRIPNVHNAIGSLEKSIEHKTIHFVKNVFDEIKRPQGQSVNSSDEKESQGHKNSSPTEKKSRNFSDEKGNQGPKNNSPITIFITSIISGLGLIYVSWKGLTIFGVNPASLLASMAGRVRIKDFKAQTGFRYRFAQEFQEVTRALYPRTMLILIDDLDRCQPYNVLETLEAINFLATSGECFIVMGMDRDRVERCVGIGFRGVAEELIEDIKGHTETTGEKESNLNDSKNDKDENTEGKRRRTEFSIQYLEKLVNIEIPVPKPTQDQSREIISPSKPNFQTEGKLRKYLTMATKIFIIVSFFSIMTVTFRSGYNAKDHAELTSKMGGKQQLELKISANEKSTNKNVANIRDKDKNNITKSPYERGKIIMPEKEHAPYYIFYLPALLFLVPVGLWTFTRRPDAIIKDSKDFKDAINIWHEVIFAKRQTPRSMKRFINRVRYFAMRQRPQDEESTLWEKIIFWTLNKEEKESSTTNTDNKPIPEPVLVALSSIHHINPDFIENEEDFTRIIDMTKSDSPDATDMSQKASNALRKTLKDHQNKFPEHNVEKWKDYIPQFIKMAKGIRVMS